MVNPSGRLSNRARTSSAGVACHATSARHGHRPTGARPVPPTHADRRQRFRPLHSGSMRSHSRPQSAALQRSSHRRRPSQADPRMRHPTIAIPTPAEAPTTTASKEGQRRVDHLAFTVHPRPHGRPGGRAPGHGHVDVVLGPRGVDVVRRPQSQRARSPVRHRIVQEHRGHRRPFVCSRAGPIDRATVDAHATEYGSEQHEQRGGGQHPRRGVFDAIRDPAREPTRPRRLTFLRRLHHTHLDPSGVDPVRTTVDRPGLGRHRPTARIRSAIRPDRTRPYRRADPELTAAASAARRRNRRSGR